MKPSQIRIRNRGRYLILGIATILWIMPSVHAQTFEWAVLAGGSAAGTSIVPETDRAVGIASDASNFVYVTGSFKGQAQFGTTTITSAGGRDAFLARYRTDGKLDWVKALGGPADDDGFGVATDGAGVVCVTGDFVQTASFDGVSLSSYGGRDIFLACFSSQGALKWVRQAGGTTGFSNGTWADTGYDVVVAGDGAVYVTGEFRGTAKFDGISVGSHGSSDGFLAKYSHDGSIVWVKRWGGSSDDDGVGLAIDPHGDVILTGFFSGAADFGSYTLNSSGAWDMYVSKWNPNGSIIWANKGGGRSNDRGLGVATDPDGNVYVTGYFKDTAVFGSQTFTATGERDGYVLKMRSDGTFDWTVPIHGEGTNHGEGIVYSGHDRIYVVGACSGNCTFGTLAAGTGGDRDAFVAELDPSGKFDWVRTGGSRSMDIGHGIALNGPRVLISGQVGGPPTFGSISLPFRGATDAFLASVDLRPQPPTLVSPEKDAAYTSTSPSLVWTPVDLATRYNLQVASDAAFASIVYTENTPATHVTFVAPVAEHEYYWRVNGVGLVGPGEWSEVGHFTAGNSGPLAPQLTAPLDNASDVSTSPLLTWIPAPKADWHHIQVSSNQAFESPEISLSHVLGTSYTPMNLSYATRYFWRVAGVSESGKSTYTTPWSFVTLEAAPDEVTLESPANGSDEVAAYTEFSWQEMSGADKYHLQVARDAAFTTLVVDDSTLTAPGYKVTTPLGYATEYHWRVRAHNAGGFGAWSPASSFVVVVGTAIEDLEVVSTGLDLRGAGRIRIAFGLPESTEIRMEVFDATGRAVALLADGFVGAGQNVFYWDAGNVASGVYFLRLIVGPEARVKSFVVVR